MARTATSSRSRRCRCISTNNNTISSLRTHTFCSAAFRRCVCTLRTTLPSSLPIHSRRRLKCHTGETLLSQSTTMCATAEQCWRVDSLALSLCTEFAVRRRIEWDLRYADIPLYNDNQRLPAFLRSAHLIAPSFSTCRQCCGADYTLSSGWCWWGLLSWWYRQRHIFPSLK